MLLTTNNTNIHEWEQGGEREPRKNAENAKEREKRIGKLNYKLRELTRMGEREKSILHRSKRREQRGVEAASRRLLEQERGIPSNGRFGRVSLAPHTHTLQGERV
jgi:hypothetical protein